MRYSFAEKVWVQGAFWILALIPITLLAYQLDVRTINDINIWTKPLKFWVSVPLHLATFAVLVQFLPKKVRFSWWIAGLAVVSTLAAILEVFPLVSQAARGVASHYNFRTTYDSIMYALMGVGAIFMTLPALIIGLRCMFLKSTEKLTPGLKLGISLGFTIGFAIAFFLGFYMSSQPGGHWVGGPPTDLGGLPIFGWSREGGDLRVSHFFGLHLMQALPFVGWLADRTFGTERATARWIVVLATLIGVGLSIGTFLQALSGQPFIGL